MRSIVHSVVISPINSPFDRNPALNFITSPTLVSTEAIDPELMAVYMKELEDNPGFTCIGFGDSEDEDL